MKLVQVTFDRDLETALSCPRCNGQGVARSGWPSNKEIECPYCEGKRIHPHPNLYTYFVPELVEVGDRVICPPWPYGNGERPVGIVAIIGSDYEGSVLSAVPESVS
jgi:DnaJ-class molecular chaperone